MPKPKTTSGQRLLRNILLEHGFGPITLEYPIIGYFVDLYLERYHVGIEYDGLHHVLKGKRDTIRQAEIEHQGLPILRVTSSELKSAKNDDYEMSLLIARVTNFTSRRGKSNI